MADKDIYHEYPSDIVRLWSKTMSAFWKDSKTDWYEEVMERVLVHGSLLRKYDIQPRGLLYLGANVGQLLWVWLLLGFRKVLLVEPQPKAFRTLERFTNASSHLLYAYDRFLDLNPPAEIQIIPCAIGDHDGEATLYVMSNSNLTSTMQPNEDALREQARNAGVAEYQQVGMVEKAVVPMATVDSLLTAVSGGLDCTDYNYLYMNLQGAELDALKGARKALEHLELIYLENNLKDRYESSPSVGELDAFLGEVGFEAVWGQIHSRTGVGFTAYVKRKAA